MDYETHSSENRAYILSKVEDKTILKFSEEFTNRFKDAKAKGIEMIFSELQTSFNLEPTNHHTFSCALTFACEDLEAVKLVTERLYFGEMFEKKNQLLSAELFNLATIKKEKGNLVMKLEGHHTLGINPNFLYELGDTWGERINQ